MAKPAFGDNDASEAPMLTAGLIDEYMLVTYPVVVGGGTPCC